MLCILPSLANHAKEVTHLSCQVRVSKTLKMLDCDIHAQAEADGKKINQTQGHCTAIQNIIFANSLIVPVNQSNKAPDCQLVSPRGSRSWIWSLTRRPTCEWREDVGGMNRRSAAEKLMGVMMHRRMVRRPARHGFGGVRG